MQHWDCLINKSLFVLAFQGEERKSNIAASIRLLPELNQKLLSTLVIYLNKVSLFLRSNKLSSTIELFY